MQTRDAKQYQVYFIIEDSYQSHHVGQDLEGKPKMEKRNHRKTIAVFTDEDTAKKYVEDMTASYVSIKHKDGHGVDAYEINPQWVELEPAEYHFNVPLNPTFVEPEPVKTEPKAADETMVGAEIKNDEAPEGIKVVKKRQD